MKSFWEMNEMSSDFMKSPDFEPEDKLKNKIKDYGIKVGKILQIAEGN